MMGIKERACGSLPPVSPDDLVPPDHCYRHLERTLDLSFVRGLVRDAYADSGRPSSDPVVCFELQLVLFCEGLRSERRLMRVVADRLSPRWDLGSDLAEPLPDHSGLTRLRERSGVDVFRRFFEQVVEQCVAAGPVWGQELSLDATDVAGNAAHASLRPRFAVEAHLARRSPGSAPDRPSDGHRCREGGDAAEEAGPPRPATPPRSSTVAAQADLAAAAAVRRDRIGEAGRPDRARTSGPYRRVADFRDSATDPGAAPLRPTGRGADLGDRAPDVVDGGKARIVPTAPVTPAAVRDDQPAPDLLRRTRFRWKLRPRRVTGDSEDGTAENVVAIEGQRIRAYVPPSEAGRRPGLFADTDFADAAAADVYRCPGDATPRFVSRCDRRRRRVDGAPAAACRAGALRAQRTTARRGRRVGRGFDADCLDRVRGYHAAEAYAKAMRKRQVRVEPLFAEAKDRHGLRRFRLRGAETVNVQAQLIAAGQNPKRLLGRWGWGRRPWPSGAAGVVLPAAQPATVAPG